MPIKGLCLKGFSSLANLWKGKFFLFIILIFFVCQVNTFSIDKKLSLIDVIKVLIEILAWCFFLFTCGPK